MLEIGDLAAWLPRQAIELYQAKGFKELYPPQAEAVERGLLEGKSMLLSMPTASGKTLLAELAMLSVALKGKRSLYIVPLRALAAEKYDSFKKFKAIGVGVGISTGDFDKKDESLGKNQIIIATSEKADSLMRNGAGWIKDLQVLVVDEIHLLDSSNRGPTLEMTITKLRKLNPKIQVVGLSATIANSREVADWLHAELVSSEWRPIKLREGVICQGKMIFPDGDSPMGKDRDEALALIKDTLEKNAQALIFENSRRNSEATAVKLSGEIVIDDEGLKDLEALSEAILATGDSGTCRRLAQCVSKGVAFHHAGLLHEQRSLVEMGFREGKVKVISSTPTLAAGLNLPARRVLIRSYKRYESGMGMAPISVMEYRQMAGRAGRPGLDPYGESFLIAKSDSELKDVMERYIFGSPEEIWSKLAAENALRTHLLATITAGFASNIAELKSFISETFYAQQQDPWHMDVTLERVVAFLAENGMIKDDDEALVPTRLGSLVSKLYIDPLSAVVMLDALKGKSRPSEITLLHLVTMTPDMELLYVNASDNWVEDFIDEHQGELNPEENFDWLLKQAKTTALLREWVREAKEEYISEVFRVGPGDIRRVAETAEWLMHSLAELSKHLEMGVTYSAEQLAERIHYGAGPDLLALLDLKGVGRVRARKLYQAGYTSVLKLKAADPADVSRVIGPKVAERILSQLSQPSLE